MPKKLTERSYVDALIAAVDECINITEAGVFERCVSLQYVYFFAQRARQLAVNSPWERYLDLLSTHPGIELRISKEIIASYLNIAPQTLSKMLRERGHP